MMLDALRFPRGDWAPSEGLLRHRDANGGPLQGRPVLIAGVRFVGPFPYSSGRNLPTDFHGSYTVMLCIYIYICVCVCILYILYLLYILYVYTL